MTQIIGVLRTAPGNSPQTGIAPVLSMDSDGTIYAHIVSGSSGGGPAVGAMVSTPFSIPDASFQILVADPLLTYFAVFNLDATNPVFINYGGGPATLIDMPIVAQGFFEPLAVPTNGVFLIAPAAASVDIILLSMLST